MRRTTTTVCNDNMMQASDTEQRSLKFMIFAVIFAILLPVKDGTILANFICGQRIVKTVCFSMDDAVDSSEERTLLSMLHVASLAGDVTRNATDAEREWLRETFVACLHKDHKARKRKHRCTNSPCHSGATRRESRSGSALAKHSFRTHGYSRFHARAARFGRPLRFPFAHSSHGRRVFFLPLLLNIGLQLLGKTHCDFNSSARLPFALHALDARPLPNRK